MFKPNYSFEKRKKELAKQRKKEEKRLRKIGETTEASPKPPLAVPGEGSVETPQGL